MPDRDVFPGLHRSWRPVGRAICGGQPVEEVSRMAEKALAQQLRRDPAAHKIGDAAAAVCDSGDASTLDQVVSSEDLRVSPALRRLHSEARRPAGVDEHDLIERTLSAMAQDQIAAVRPQLIVDGGRSAAEATRYLEDCTKGMRIASMADQIARGSQQVRAPRTTRRSTAELLYTPLT